MKVLCCKNENLMTSHFGSLYAQICPHFEDLFICLFACLLSISWDSFWPLYTLYFDEINPEINAWFDNLADSSGATIKDIFPTKFDELRISIQDAYFNLYLDLAYLLHEYVYWEIPGFDHVQYSVNASFGSERYHQIKNDFNISFVQSGILKAFFESDLLQIYDPEENLTLDEFVDTAYREFNIEMGFDMIFQLMYAKQHTTLINLALRIREETDSRTLTTTYLR